MSKIKLILSGLALVTLLAAGCNQTAGTASQTTTNPVPPVTVVRLSADLQPIFNANCVVCHQGSSAPAGLVLESGQAYGKLVNQPSVQSGKMRVAPGSLENSYLVNKLEGTQSSGNRMPPSGALPAAQIELIKRWISTGAPNN